MLLFIFMRKFFARAQISRLLQIVFVKNYTHQKIVSHLLNFPQIARAISASNRKYDDKLMVYPCRAKYLQRSGTEYSVKSQEKRDFLEELHLSVVLRATNEHFRAIFSRPHGLSGLQFAHKVCSTN